jgi:hypothetical protein
MHGDLGLGGSDACDFMAYSAIAERGSLATQSQHIALTKIRDF